MELVSELDFFPGDAARRRRGGHGKHVDHRREAGDRGLLEQVAHGQIDAKRRADRVHDLDRLQGMTTEIEEIVVDAGSSRPERLGEDGRDSGLGGGAGRNAAGGRRGLGIGRGQRLRSSLPLGVRGSAASGTKWRAPCTRAAPARRAARSCRGGHGRVARDHHVGHEPARRPGRPGGGPRHVASRPAGPRSAASISPSSMRKPRIFTWSSMRPRYSRSPSASRRARSPVRYSRAPGLGGERIGDEALGGEVGPVQVARAPARRRRRRARPGRRWAPAPRRGRARRAAGRGSGRRSRFRSGVGGSRRPRCGRYVTCTVVSVIPYMLTRRGAAVAVPLEPGRRLCELERLAAEDRRSAAPGRGRPARPRRRPAMSWRNADGVWFRTVTRSARSSVVERLRRPARLSTAPPPGDRRKQRAPDLPHREVERVGVEQRPDVVARRSRTSAAVARTAASRSRCVMRQPLGVPVEPEV